MFARVLDRWRRLPTWKKCSLAFMTIGLTSALAACVDSAAVCTLPSPFSPDNR